jgi:glutaredoxin-like YruB-family protein
MSKITIYGAEWCAFCHMEMRYFDEKGIEYTYLDIDKDQKLAEEVVTKSGQRGIPVTDIDGEIIIGFDKPKLDKALAIPAS